MPDIKIGLTEREQALLLANELNDHQSWSDIAGKIRAARRPAEEVARLVALAHELGVTGEDLDDYVHDAASNPASQINNDGLDAQITYLAAELGTEGAEANIRQAARG